VRYDASAHDRRLITLYNTAVVGASAWMISGGGGDDAQIPPYASSSSYIVSGLPDFAMLFLDATLILFALGAKLTRRTAFGSAGAGEGSLNPNCTGVSRPACTLSGTLTTCPFCATAGLKGGACLKLGDFGEPATLGGNAGRAGLPGAAGNAWVSCAKEARAPTAPTGDMARMGGSIGGVESTRAWAGTGRVSSWYCSS